MIRAQKADIMKKSKFLVFTRILYVLFSVGTIISLFIVYKDIDGDNAFRFLVGYLFFTIFLLGYITFITILNARKLKWTEIRKSLFKFIILFVSFGTLNYMLDYIFRPNNMSLFKNFSIAFGLAFGVAFAEVTFLKKN